MAKKLPLRINISKELTEKSKDNEKLVGGYIGEKLAEAVAEAILHGTGPLAEARDETTGKSIMEMLREQVNDHD